MQELEGVIELLYEQKRKYWEHRHPGQHIPARDKVAVCCAMHDESNPSCTLYLDGNGGYNCHACGAKGNLFQFEARFSNCSLQQAEINVAEITGATPSAPMGDLGPPVAFYDYRDENAITLFQKRRYEPELGHKTFLIYRPDGRGWISKLDPANGPPTRRVLFNLPDLIKANVVFLCEGEKDCINLGSANLFSNAGFSIACTCTYDGAWQENHSPKWLENYNPYFTGRTVFIFADNDAPGRLYAETAAAGILKYAYRTRVVYFSELPEKGDASDYLELYGKEKLEDKIKSAQLWTQQSIERENWLVEAVAWASAASEETDWLIDGVIQADANGIIAAEPKTGKSLAALDLLISLATGQCWLGQAVRRRVRTAYISREDSPLLTKTRIRGFLQAKGVAIVKGAFNSAEDWLWCNTREQLGDFDICNDEQLGNMARDLKERGIEFAILDVFNRIHNKAENDNSEMARVVERISQMGREAGCSLGVVHHVSKENGTTGRFFTRIRGASSIHGWTEWSIGLTLVNANAANEINPDGTKTKLIRRAEFESKAGETAPIYFTIGFGRGNLSLDVTSGDGAQQQQRANTPTAYRVK